MDMTMQEILIEQLDKQEKAKRKKATRPGMTRTKRTSITEEAEHLRLKRETLQKTVNL